jgi:multidrug efflux system membrane fusion protein
MLVIHRRSAATQSAGGGGRGAAGNFPVPVTLGHARTKNVPIYLDGLGTVQAFNTVTIHTRVDGQLIKVAFTEGQDVKTGDLLAEIDPAPYQAALDQATAKKAQDTAQLANARLDLQRYADLLKTEGTTQQTYDTQKALVDQLDATVKADQAAIDAAKVNLDYCTIRSPLDGRTGIRLVDQGNIVHASDTSGLVVLTQLKPISVVFTLPETALNQIQAKQDADNPFTVLAAGRDDTNILASGQLAVIDNQIDPTTGTIKLKANFANENLRLWPGEFVNTRLLLETREDSVVVPASVVQRGPDGAFAFVVTNAADGSTNQIAKMRPIQVAQIDNGEALIDSGLDAGETIVVDGQYKLQDGSKVRPSASAGGAGGGHRKGQGKNSGTNRVDGADAGTNQTAQP